MEIDGTVDAWAPVRRARRRAASRVLRAPGAAGAAGDARSLGRLLAAVIGEVDGVAFGYVCNSAREIGPGGEPRWATLLAAVRACL